MAKYINFYENIAEAQMRLRGTVVMYDGQPVHIWGIADHKGDGVFRAYVSPIEDVNFAPAGNPVNQIPANHPGFGPSMDTWMQSPAVKALDKFRIQRKKLDSPLFDKFRPFPLGMMNNKGKAVYVERQPNRPKTEQGLIDLMLYTIPIELTPGRSSHVDMYTKEFKHCILGEHPTPKEVLDGLTSDKYVNESVAFNRKFALLKGPIDLLFLNYKGDTIGVLPNSDFSKVVIGRNFHYLKEVVDELNLFSDIRLQ